MVADDEVEDYRLPSGKAKARAVTTAEEAELGRGLGAHQILEHLGLLVVV
jgi:hypothetical protein